VKNGVNYRPSERSKSEIYLSFLPMVMSGQVELIDHKKLLNQLVDLERRARSGGRDSVDHSPGAHDDIANATAGAVVKALADTVELTWARMVNAPVEKFGDKWRDFIAADDASVEEPNVEAPFHPPGAPANGREFFSENVSVMKAQAAQKPVVFCPQCQIYLCRSPRSAVSRELLWCGVARSRNGGRAARGTTPAGALGFAFACAARL